ncbi:MAG: hypothetical protein DIU52_008285 [bacterium]
MSGSRILQCRWCFRDSAGTLRVLDRLEVAGPTGMRMTSSTGLYTTTTQPIEA